MHSFDFHNPVKIVFGQGVLSRLGPETRLHGQRALLVYGGGSVERNGILGQARESLRQAGMETVEFGGVRPNPGLAHLRQGIALARAERVEVIVAVGGGSVIDMAKAVAGGACTDADVWQFFLGRLSFPRALPLLAVSTMPATGSEMNCGLVITNEETGQKLGGFDPALFPKASFCDPAATLSIPPAYLAYAAVDAMSHLMEGYLTRRDGGTDLQDRYAEGILKTLMEAVEQALAEPQALGPRATLMWGACLAWNGLALAGVGAVQFPNHMLEHPLSARHQLAHGAGLALVIPAWLRWATAKDPRPAARFARNVLGIQEAEDTRAAAAGIERLAAWYRKIGAPTSFQDAGVAEPDIDWLVRQSRDIALLWGMGDDYPEETIRAILEGIPRK